MSHPGGAVHGVTPPLFAAWTFDLWVAVPLGLAVDGGVRRGRTHQGEAS